MSKIEFIVDGMHCGGCCSRLKRVLEAAAGIDHAQVVLETRQLSVDFDAGTIDQDTIKGLISGAGFGVVSCSTAAAG